MTDKSRPYKLGLIHDHNPPEVPDLSVFATTAPQAPPAAVEAPQPAGGWPMALNNELGDCTIAGEVHVDQAGAIIVGEPWSYPGDDAVKGTYFGLTGGADSGLLLANVLRPWNSPGGFGIKNGGYASVNPKNTTLVKQSIWIFGNAYIGVNLPMPAQQQFNPDGSGVWELTGTSADYQIEGGHCVVPVGYTAEGVIAVTWGSTVLITWEWWATYVTQAYAVVPPAFVEKGGDARGFDIAAIEQFVKNLTPPAPPVPWWKRVVDDVETL